MYDSKKWKARKNRGTSIRMVDHKHNWVSTHIQNLNACGVQYKYAEVGKGVLKDTKPFG